MSKALPTYPRILAVAPNTSGFGFALMEGLNTLADWGNPEITKDKNNGCIARVGRMIKLYEPHVLVMEDSMDDELRRAARIKMLVQDLAELAEAHSIKVAIFQRRRVRRIFFPDGSGTRQEMATILARWYPEELALRLPPKRKFWAKEPSRMAIFDAVALALAFRQKK